MPTPIQGNWAAAKEPEGHVVAWLPIDPDKPPIIVAVFESDRDARIAAYTLNSLDATPGRI
jgi:hypothetical protein